ncbi:hypothetical protein EVAR_27075_1 [Eumeta japonica]|uniref:Uncharacterized protein n=1 Tax=Eumeta variegata TaxID=151549 RepID=A0A4C1VJF0_EUMVA|nr:hypothetical protein EVAR_27075_1 [Eumeta japonica]
MEPAARTKNMTHAALPRSVAFHLRLEVQARARNERQRGTIGLHVRQHSRSVSLLLDTRLLRPFLSARLYITPPARPLQTAPGRSGRTGTVP